jgi:hypothetical protein
MPEKLTYYKTLKDGRVLAVNSWNTGWQGLVYPNRVTFDLAKEVVERDQTAPDVMGYAEVPE